MPIVCADVGNCDSAASINSLSNDGLWKGYKTVSWQRIRYTGQAIGKMFVATSDSTSIAVSFD